MNWHSFISAYFVTGVIVLAILGTARSSYALDPTCGQVLMMTKKLDLLAWSAYELNPILKNSKIIVYPASGFDLMTAFALAPNAHTVIGIDRHPYRGIDQDAGVDVDLRHDRPWSIAISEVDRAQFMERGLLQSLKAWRPNATIISSSVMRNGAQVNGLIEFDLNDGKGIRRYFHVHDSLPEGGGALSKNVQFHLNLKPDTLLLKAAMRAAGPIQTVIADDSGVFKIARAIIGRQGTIVDCDGNDWGDVAQAQRILRSSGTLGYSTATAYSFERSAPEVAGPAGR